MLETTGLACERGSRRLFSDLSFALGAGGLLHVRGANGSGKTSLLRILAGLARAAAGTVLWRGESGHFTMAGDVAIDLDGDSRDEIVFAANDWNAAREAENTLHLWDASGPGERSWGAPLGSTSKHRPTVTTSAAVCRSTFGRAGALASISDAATSSRATCCRPSRKAAGPTTSTTFRALPST